METQTNETTSTNEVRPFRIDIPEEAIADLRRRIAATDGPTRKPSPMLRRACSWRRLQALARYWGTDYDFAEVGGEAECPAAVHDRDRWARHAFHSRAFET